MRRLSLYPLFLAAVALAAVLIPRHGVGREAAAEAHFAFFLRAASRGDWSEAEDRLARARRVAPENAYYEGCWGWLQERRAGEGRWSGFVSLPTYAASRDRGRLASASRAFTRALVLNPDDDAFLHSLAWLEFFEGRSDSARDLLHRALEQERGIALYQVSRGLMAEWEDRAAEADDAYGEALVCSPALVDSRFFRQLSARRRDTARRALEHAEARLTAQLQGQAAPIASAKLGSLLVFRRDWVAADHRLRSALADLPALSRAWVNLARVSLASGRLRQAEQCLARARALDPSDPLLWRVTADRQRQVEAGQEAVEALEKAQQAARGQASEHALRAARIYKIKDPLKDDVIPQGLLDYSTPGGGGE
jgi:tetratricopeptide (TPR) repeat protein